MRKTTFGALFIAIFATAACGGDEKEPVKAPPPPPPVTATMTAAPTPPPTDTTPPPPPPKPTMVEMQVASAKTAMEALNAHDAKKFAAGFTDDGIVTSYGMGDAKGKDAIAAELQRWFDAFPDLKIGFSHLYLKGDMAAIEWVVNGTHSGDLMGIKPTQKPVGYHGANVLWFDADGKIKAEHRYYDAPTMFAQLGLVKQPFRAIPPLPASMEQHMAKGTPDEDKNVELVKGFYGTFDSKKDADFLNLITEDSVYDDMPQEKASKGKKAAKDWFVMFTKAFPDLKTQVTTSFAAGDVVVSEVTMSGTHKGALGPLRATGKPMSMHGLDFMHLKDGKIVKGSGYSNTKELFEQLGLFKMPAPPPAPKAPATPPPAKPK